MPAEHSLKTDLRWLENRTLTWSGLHRHGIRALVQWRDDNVHEVKLTLQYKHTRVVGLLVTQYPDVGPTLGSL